MNSQPTALASKTLKVLVAEDNTINQRLVIALLTALGHTVVVVGDGEKALKCLSKLQFDVLLMDVMMPNMDGLQALASIRAQEHAQGGHLPIIMVTAHTEPSEQAKFMQAGADGFVAKPVQLAHLCAELDRVVPPR